MNLLEVREFLAWCLGLNYALLLIWFGMFTLGHDQVYRLHRRWFQIPMQTFDTLHYAAMLAYKLAVFLFNVVPLLVLHLTTMR